MAKTLHFKNKEGYRKWLAFGHVHGLMAGKHVENIVIAGKKHNKQ